MKKILKNTLKGAGGLVGLLVAFHLVEDVRGRHAWSSYLEERRSAGLPMDMASLAPPPVPESENFAAVPLIDGAIKGKEWGISFASLGPAWDPKLSGDWRLGKRADLGAIQGAYKEDLDAVLAPYGPMFATLAEAAKRPRSRFLLNYTTYDDFIPPLLGFRAVARTLRVRALVHLKKGRDAAALEDIGTSLRVAQHLGQEPVLITQLLRTAWLNLSLQPVWEGLQDHRWNEAQLASLQEQLGGIDALSAWKRSFQSEQVLHITTQRPGWWAQFKEGSHWSRPAAPHLATLDVLWRSLLLPSGWELQNRVRAERAFESATTAPVDPEHHRVHPDRSRKAVAAMEASGGAPYTFLMHDYVPALIGQNMRVARLQTGLDSAATACALERYRLAKMAYPATLQELVGPYLRALPQDLVSGAPLRYERTPGGGYRLWSVGWDAKDDGGTNAGNPLTQETGDWVWQVQ